MKMLARESAKLTARRVEHRPDQHHPSHACRTVGHGRRVMNHEMQPLEELTQHKEASCGHCITGDLPPALVQLSTHLAKLLPRAQRDETTRPRSSRNSERRGVTHGVEQQWRDQDGGPCAPGSRDAPLYAALPSAWRWRACSRAYRLHCWGRDAPEEHGRTHCCRREFKWPSAPCSLKWRNT